MRLHSLTATAFGPFAEEVAVDFDALAAAQVFLLCGEIGAGKTMVLDAVCFALYGDVPTDRGRARQLRSHFAADGVAPRVVLEATIGGRRWRFTRSPSWVRPKRRGTGTTTEQAAALVEELVEGDWSARATRLDEAGMLVGDLLGMTLGQFSQVVMLPQGQFDTFLRASSEERQRVLTRLFRTRRFEDVEAWLTERRTSLRRSGEVTARRVASLLDRISEATDEPVPAWDDLAAAAEDHGLEVWLSDLEVRVADAAAEAVVERDGAAADLETSVAVDAAAQQVHDLRRRHATACNELDALAATADTHRADADRLDAARRAALVVTPRRLAGQARRETGRSDAEVARALADAADLVADLHPDRPLGHEILDQRAGEAAARAAVAEDFVPRARELTRAHVRLRELRSRLAGLLEERARVAARSEELPGLLSAAESALPDLRARAGTADAVRSKLVDLAKRAARFATMTELEFQVATFATKRDQQQTVLLDLRHRLLDVRETRLRGMAAELAAAMAVGGSCPVCGSHEHPHPAVAAPDAPDEDTEQRLQSELDDAEVLLETHRDQVRSYSARLATITDELAGTTEEGTVADLAASQADLAAAEQAASELAGQESRLASLRSDLEETAGTLARCDTQVAVTEQQAAATQEVVATLVEDLARLLDDVDPGAVADADPVAAVTDQARRARQATQRLTAARDALTEQSRCRTHQAQAEAEATRAARSAGFGSPEAARRAELDAASVEQLAQRQAARAAQETAARAVLADDEVIAAAARPEPDLLLLGERRRAATARHAACVARAELAARRHHRLTACSASLRTELDAWTPVRREYVVVRSLSELAEGKGPDNPLQVRLSAYVLASRLSQVVDAANERLRTMTDGRFLLEHTADRGVGERRGGLSLLVRDLWTDVARDPVTLSGGETFVVSLALALGLADVVTAEVGCTRVDTLFVDEGFGSLDADTLELVMDTLDDLRSGGRVVGVVSHVPELRDRIPAQLVVHKGRSGSWLEQPDRSVGSSACR